MTSILEKEFTLSAAAMRRIIRDFHLEMARGLAGKRSSLAMIPAYADRPTGAERGTFIALDFGGTNFRILELTLAGRGRYAIVKAGRFTIPPRLTACDAATFFDFIADCIRRFLPSGIDASAIDLGFTFSFPVTQTGIARGVLLRWTKGFRVRGVVGKDVVRLLGDALRRQGMSGITVAALLNDTVGTLVARSYADPRCDIGVILGTGTNACYTERLSRIAKWRGGAVPTGRMIVNIEWGNFDKLPRTRYDRALDRTTNNPGEQTLEKMVSGMYLGRLTQIVLSDLGIIAPDRDLTTDDIAAIENDRTPRLTRIASVLERLGAGGMTLRERRLVREAYEIVSARGARIAAATLAAVLTAVDPQLTKRHTVAVDGSVFEKHPTFAKHMRAALGDIFARRARRITLCLTKDGSGVGAAILAAVAASPY